MGNKTNISWTDATYNIARGCTKVDEDCKFCYMYRDSFDNTRYNPLEVVKTKTVFNMPLKYKETESKCWPGRPLIFTSSLTDFFHEGCDSFRMEAWDIIRQCPHLIFQILTKRPERIMQSLPPYWDEICERIWLGTSVGSSGEKGKQRMECLAKLELNCVKFLSLEPLYSDIDLTYNLVGIVHPDNEGYGVSIVKAFDWVITGGESGNETGKYQYRECKIEWIESVVDQCQEAGVPVFVKQMGTFLSKQMGLKSRHGSDINEFPIHLQIREFPDINALVY